VDRRGEGFSVLGSRGGGRGSVSVEGWERELVDKDGGGESDARLFDERRWSDRSVLDGSEFNNGSRWGGNSRRYEGGERAWRRKKEGGDGVERVRDAGLRWVDVSGRGRGKDDLGMDDRRDRAESGRGRIAEGRSVVFEDGGGEDGFQCAGRRIRDVRKGGALDDGVLEEGKASDG
jgi:hypothetical protein